MKNADLYQLIDEYLLGTIAPEQKAQLENQIATDPAVAQLVRESRLAFDAIRVARDQQRRVMLKKLDADSSGRPDKKRFLLRLIGSTGMLMLVFWLIWHFAPAQLANRYLEHDAQMTFLMAPEQQTAWEQAFLFFEKKEYEKATSVFRALAENENDQLSAAASWNSMMCALALHGVIPDWEKEMKISSEFAQKPYHIKADRLFRTIDFPGYRWFYSRVLRQGASLIKPSII